MGFELRFFQPAEFGVWFDQMSPKLLNVIDGFREEWGAPVSVSKSAHALGRYAGDSKSQHNVDLWGEVRAADLFPKAMNDAADFAKAYECAKRAGASGIGIYTDTSRPMIHLDVREDRTPESPANWSRINGNYGALSELMPEGWKA